MPQGSFRLVVIYGNVRMLEKGEVLLLVSLAATLPQKED